MDGFELNKIAGAVLGTALGIMAVSVASEFIYEPHGAEEPGYVITVALPGDGPAGGGTTVEPVEPIAARLQVADVADGQSVARKCAVCHTFNSGGEAKIGPNLYGIVGNQAAHMEGFAYSQSMRTLGAEGQQWTYESLDRFLADPKGTVAGTLMNFPGLPKADDRADVIAYLRTLAESPVPLPDPPPPADTAAADGEPPADAPADGEPAPVHSDPLPPPAPEPEQPATEAPTAPL